MKGTRIFILFALWVATASAFAGSDERFLKKYAMMKIYESCFGGDVVKQIRQEMKNAVQKCAAAEEQANHIVPTLPPEPIPSSPPGGDSTKDVFHDSPSADGTKATFDPEKLHQAILAYRPNPFQSTFRPYPQPGFYPYASPVPYYPGAAPIPYTQFPGYPQFYPQPPYFNPAMRMSRDMDFKNNAEALTNRLTGRVKNVTCVMQELGYIDGNLEPTYEKIQSKVRSLPIDNELKQDISDGVSFCQQFSQCIPEVIKEKSPLSHDLIRPMFFFRCYKHKKLEACIMKDVRERFSADNEGLETYTEPELQLRRGKAMSSEKKDATEDLASSIYDFIYGNDSMDFDAIL